MRPTYTGPCPLAKKCGGCQLQNMEYERQLHFKEGKVRALFGAVWKSETDFGDGIPLSLPE